MTDQPTCKTCGFEETVIQTNWGPHKVCMCDVPENGNHAHKVALAAELNVIKRTLLQIVRDRHKPKEGTTP